MFPVRTQRVPSHGYDAVQATYYNDHSNISSRMQNHYDPGLFDVYSTQPVRPRPNEPPFFDANPGQSISLRSGRPTPQYADEERFAHSGDASRYAAVGKTTSETYPVVLLHDMRT